ncbi:hypothetical protein ANTPLA_LOCUS517 [Anthophora plagiata]
MGLDESEPWLSWNAQLGSAPNRTIRGSREREREENSNGTLRQWCWLEKDLEERLSKECLALDDLCDRILQVQYYKISEIESLNEISTEIDVALNVLIL